MSKPDEKHSTDEKVAEIRVKEIDGIGDALRKGYEDHKATEKKFEDEDKKEKKK